MKPCVEACLQILLKIFVDGRRRCGLCGMPPLKELNCPRACLMSGIIGAKTGEGCQGSHLWIERPSGFRSRAPICRFQVGTPAVGTERLAPASEP